MFSTSSVRNGGNGCLRSWMGAPQREANTFDLVSGSTSHIAFEVISALGVESIADCPTVDETAYPGFFALQVSIA
ncbi:hypothetical protein BOTCAL_0108g00070 [Botryotinia calthae]|uniref:Uncharacterized protein n=1 Tax=Botryotinia calthae TaxID=38488 RepID=A0A4Y8D7W5_9HELO|nr:hypothetical protein BOTCAL_0108g00070 [Botryotinia calthae]